MHGMNNATPADLFAALFFYKKKSLAGMFLGKVFAQFLDRALTTAVSH